nr:uncharacterized protein LOC117835344 [Setaria viridis]
MAARGRASGGGAGRVAAAQSERGEKEFGAGRGSEGGGRRSPAPPATPTTGLVELAALLHPAPPAAGRFFRRESASGTRRKGGIKRWPWWTAISVSRSFPTRSSRRSSPGCRPSRRGASAAWSATLSSDYFVDLHARRANRPDRPRFLLTAVGDSYDGYLYSWQPGGAVEELVPDEFGRAVTVPLTSKPCRGLVLVRSCDHGGYFVFNPSTGEALALPDSEKPLKMKLRLGISRWKKPELPHYVRVSYGLGYCTMRKEYKETTSPASSRPRTQRTQFALSTWQLFQSLLHCLSRQLQGTGWAPAEGAGRGSLKDGRGHRRRAPDGGCLSLYCLLLSGREETDGGERACLPQRVALRPWIGISR